MSEFSVIIIFQSSKRSDKAFSYFCITFKKNTFVTVKNEQCQKKKVLWFGICHIICIHLSKCIHLNVLNLNNSNQKNVMENVPHIKYQESQRPRSTDVV